MNEYRFVELCTGGVRNRGQIIELPESKSLDFLGKNNVTDCFASAYRFGPDFADHVAKTGSVRDFNGPCSASQLWFDFDSYFGDLALVEVRGFIEKILTHAPYGILVDQIQPYFSGNKGFHVYIDSPEIIAMPPAQNTPDRIKKLCTALAGRFSSFDRAVYDRSRLLRVLNSRHSKSGLYKIPLCVGDLIGGWALTWQQIRDRARHQQSLSNSADKFLERRYYNGLA